MRDRRTLSKIAEWDTHGLDPHQLLLDGHGPGQPGGRGEAFDWSRAPALGRPVLLAGGLHAGNVGEAIRAAVDAFRAAQTDKVLAQPDPRNPTIAT